MNKREEEILEAISAPEWKGLDRVSAEKLAAFLARMEGSKEDGWRGMKVAPPAVGEIGTGLLTPPSEEKKCCDTCDIRKRGFRPNACAICPCHSPTPPDAWEGARSVQVAEENKIVDAFKTGRTQTLKEVRELVEKCRGEVSQNRDGFFKSGLMIAYYEILSRLPEK